MSEYLDRVKDGEDAKLVILDMQKVIDERNLVIQKIYYRVLLGGDASELVTDVMEAIPCQVLVRKTS